MSAILQENQWNHFLIFSARVNEDIGAFLVSKLRPTSPIDYTVCVVSGIPLRQRELNWSSSKRHKLQK